MRISVILSAVLLFPIGTVCAFAECFLLDISLPITGQSSHAVVRSLERTVQEISEQKISEQKNPDQEISVQENQQSQRTESKPVEEKPALESTPTVILCFKVNADQEEFGRGSSFGACYELADLLVSGKFHGIRTVAYFPQSVRGHALLVALACSERIAAESAEIGEAGIDETTISSTQQQAYQEISKRRRTLPPAMVDKLLDRQTELIQIETEKGIRLVSPAEVKELRQTETFAAEPTTLIPSGAPGLFTADAARKLGLINLIANDRVALARGLGFRPDEIKNAPISGEQGHAVRINLTGLMNSDKVGSAIRSIQTALEPNPVTINQRKVGTVKVDFLCLYIDSPGGDIEASLNMASYLARNIDSTKVRTVAYIPYQARSDAAIIALACDETVLGPGAILGGDGANVFSVAQITDARQMIREFLSQETIRSWSLPVGFVDPDIEIFKATRSGRLIDYFCDEELKQLPDAELWKKGETVKEKGKLLQIVGGKGEQYFVDRSAKDFAEFKFLYGLEDEPLLVEPTWADQLVQSLSSPGMSAFILLIVFLAVTIEAQTPGIGIGAFVAAVGIVLFFWLHFLGGTAGWLEVSLFLVGVVCVLLEMFVLPGVGIFGIGGAIAMITSLVLASQTFIIPQNSYQFSQLRGSFLILAVSGIGVLILGNILARTLHNANKPKNTALIQETEKLAHYDPLLGQTGVTMTPLVPAGKAIIGGEPINVVSDGELIEKGETVKVIEVVGYKVVVRKMETTDSA
jgi:membrane-bound ClpP family serine protease